MAGVPREPAAYFGYTQIYKARRVDVISPTPERNKSYCFGERGISPTGERGISPTLLKRGE